MEKVTILALALGVLLVVGAVFAAADFIDAAEVAESSDGDVAASAPQACGAGGDCGAGCGGQCGGTCGVASCGCGK